MKDEEKTQVQLIEELAELRLQKEEWKAAETRLLAEIQSLSAERDLFAEFGREVNSELDIDRVYEITANKLAVLVPYDRMVVTLTEVPGDDTRGFVRGVEIRDGRIGMKTRPNLTPIPRRMDGSILYGSVTEAEYFFPEVQAAGLESWAEVPLGPPESPLGYLSVRSKKKNAYSEADIELLHRISYQISPAFRNARLYLMALRETSERTILAEKLQRQKEWLEVTLSSIGDAVMATDTSETILFMNPVAEALTGWTTQEALGKKVNEVFYIINEQTRQPAEGPIKRVLEEGLIVGLANHTALISREGKEISIADSGAPITGADGVIQGVIMVFRDITDRKQAEEATWVNLALQRVRNEVLQMDSEESWAEVVVSFYREVEQLVGFHDCSLNLVDQQNDSVVLYIVDSEYKVGRKEAPIPSVIKRVIETGQYMYRPNRADPFFGDMPEKIHSVIDLPFMGGTLAVNSTEENAFSERDIHVLEQFSQVMSEANRRLQDITERQQAEDALEQEYRLRDADNAVRIAVASINEPQDLEGVLVEVSSQLTGFGVVHDAISLQIMNTAGTSMFSVGTQIGTDSGWDSFWERLKFVYVSQEGTISFQKGYGEENEAILEDVAKVIDVWRNGTFRYEPCTPEGLSFVPPGMTIVDVAFSHGTLAINRKQPHAFGAEDIALLQRFARMISEGFQRFLYVTERKQMEERQERLLRQRNALASLRQRLLEMFSPDDLDSLLETVGEALRTAGIPHQAYSLNTVDHVTEPPIMRVWARSPEGRWDTWHGEDILLDMWRRGEIVYRRDLLADDPLGERGQIKVATPPRSVIDIPFSHGTLGLNSPEPSAFTDEHVDFLRAVAETLSAAYRHWDSLRQLERARALDHASALLDSAIWDMAGTEDITRVVSTVRDSLGDLGVPFDHCSVNLVDAPTDIGRVQRYAGTQDDGMADYGVTAQNALETTWSREGKVVYRPDLDEDDPYGERDLVRHLYGTPVRAVLDVPFSHGTLAVNSTRPYAFSEEDVRALEAAAQGLTTGFHRLADLRALEERNRALAVEITGRRLVEDLLRASLQREEALGRVRDQMIQAADIPTLLSIIEKSCKSEMIGLGVPVQGITLEIPSEREGFYHVLAFEYYAKHGNAHLSEDHPLAKASTWLVDAWGTGRPVVVDRKQIEEDGRLRSRLRPELRQSLVEVPLVEPKGSVGISSGEPNAFEGEALKTVEIFVRFIGLGLCRIRDIAAMKQAEGKLKQHRDHLEELVGKRTAELETINKELEAFSSSVSHDLRAPLRHISGFVNLLREDYGSGLDAPGRRHLDIIAESAQRMGRLIDDLLTFSRAGRTDMHLMPVDLRALVEGVVQEIQEEVQGRNILWDIGALPTVHADQALLRLVLVNLLDNAVKYTRPRDRAEIRIGHRVDGESGTTFFVQDNGVGFDMQYADKLFGVFQRLHRVEEFEGTGIGLANVQRIIHRHGGRVWAEGAVDGGATFYVFLPNFRGR